MALPGTHSSRMRLSTAPKKVLGSIYRSSFTEKQSCKRENKNARCRMKGRSREVKLKTVDFRSIFMDPAELFDQAPGFTGCCVLKRYSHTLLFVN